MKVFLVNIPTQNTTNYYKLCEEILTDYFHKYNIETFILEKNEFGVNPSWLKLKCFDYVDDDFVLCWDMDLLPRKSSPNILPDLDLNKMNLCVDSIFYTKTTEVPPIPLFRYNCGLIGIPKSYKPMIDEVFSEAKTSQLPSYEQYPMNFRLAKNNFVDVHELDRGWNCIYHLPGENSFIKSAKCIHYTGDVIVDVRERLIQDHHKLYFS